MLENRRDALNVWAIPPEKEKYRINLRNSINFALQNLRPGDTISDINIPVLTNANYDLAAALAYLNAFENSPNIPVLQPSDIITMTPSSQIPGANFLQINNNVYSREGDFILLNTGFGEKIKIRDMKIEGIKRVHPRGFQGADSFQKGRVGYIEGGLQGGAASRYVYKTMDILAEAPEILEIYEKFISDRFDSDANVGVDERETRGATLPQDLSP